MVNGLFKKTYKKNIVREVKTTRSRFLSIFGIVLLGACMLTGLMSVSPDMAAAGNRYFAESNLTDLRVMSTLGLTQENLDAIAAVEGVASIQEAKTIDCEVTNQLGDTLVMRAHSLPADGTADGPEDINRLSLLEGRLPTEPGECVVQPLGFLEGVQVGDTITLKEEQDLNEQVYTIVGVVQSPMNFSIDGETSTAGDGTLDFVAYLPDSEFTMDYLTVCYIKVAGTEGMDTYSEAYDAVVDPVKERLETISAQQVEIRRSQIVEDAQAELDTAKAEYEEKKQEADTKLAEAEAELDAAQAKLDAAKQELDVGEKQYQDGKNQLAEQRKNLPETLHEGSQQIVVNNESIMKLEGDLEKLRIAVYMLEVAKPLEDSAETMLDFTQQQLEELQQNPDVDPEKLTKAQAAYDKAQESYNQVRAQVDQYQAQVDEVKRQLYGQGLLSSANISNMELLQQSADALIRMKSALLEGQMQITSAYGELERAEQILEDGRAKLDEGWAQYAAGQQELEEGRSTFEQEKADALQKLQDAEDQINDAQAQIDDIAAGEWFVLTRDQIKCFASFEQNIERIGDIARVFPVFFFLVAALVALTTMTRMVEENRQQIGTFKALGYSEAAITGKYLIYALAASLSGAVCGMIFGFVGFPTVIWIAYSIMYQVPTFRIMFYPWLIVVSILASVSVVTLATLNACHATLSEKPAALMLPKAPPAGKRILLERITPLWKRMSFSHKVTARNLMRYKKRFFMTVLGVAGCTALLLVGFGLQDSIMEIIDVQYSRLYHFDMTASFSNKKALSEPRGLLEEIDTSEHIQYHDIFYTKNVTISNETEDEGTTTLTVSQNGVDLSQYFTLQTRRGKKPIPYEDNSVVLTEKTAEVLGVSAGDTIWLHQTDGERIPLKITGVNENYLSSRLIVSPVLYEQLTGSEPEWNTILAQTDANGDTQVSDALVKQLLTKNYVTTVFMAEDQNATFANVIGCINYVVLLVIFCAASLAALVLYNLININIAERKKELATIKVLGFFEGEVNRYIFREIYILSLIGAVVGLAIGVPLHQFIIRTVEIDQMMFVRSIAPSSYLYSVALTMLFTFVVSAFMRRLVNRISMVESMKAPE